MIELLESRIAPAGLIELIVKNGALTIQSIADDTVDGNESISVFATNANTIQVSGIGGTNIKLGDAISSAATVTGIQGDVKIFMGNGADSLILTQLAFLKNLTIDTGAGDDTLSIDGVRVLGSATVKMQGGTDTVSLAPAGIKIGKNMLLDMGAGRAQLSASPNALLQVGKNFTVLSGAADDDLLWEEGRYVIGGNVLFSSGGGIDSVGIAATGPTSSIHISGNATIKAVGSLDPDFGDQTQLRLSAANVHVAKKVTFTSGNNSSAGLIANNQLTVQGDVVFQFGPGVLGGATIAAQHTYIGGGIRGTSAADAGTLNPSLGKSAYIGKGVTSVGFASLFISSDSASGIIKGNITATTTPGKSLNVFLPLNNGISILGNGTFTAAPSDTNLLFVDLYGANWHGSITARSTTASNDFLNLENVTVQGRITVDFGAGNDQFNIERNNTFPATTLLGAIKLIGGPGNDTYLLGGDFPNQTLQTFASITLDGGPGTNTLTLGTVAQFALPLILKGFPV